MITRSRNGASRKIIRTTLWLALAALIAAVLTGVTMLMTDRIQRSDLRTWADVGQACGMFSAVAAVAALAAFVVTFTAQQREAREHRAELRLQCQALADSERQLHRSAETGLSMFHLNLISLGINNPNLARVWPTTSPDIPDHLSQQYQYCTLVLEGIWLNARVGRFNEADVRASVAYLLTSPVFRQYWQAFRSKREMAAAADGPESQYFATVDELYAATE